MKTFKKVLVFLLTLTTLCTLCACGNSAEEGTVGETQKEFSENVGTSKEEPVKEEVNVVENDALLCEGDVLLNSNGVKVTVDSFSDNLINNRDSVYIRCSIENNTGSDIVLTVNNGLLRGYNKSVSVGLLHSNEDANGKKVDGSSVLVYDKKTFQAEIVVSGTDVLRVFGTVQFDLTVVKSDNNENVAAKTICRKTSEYQPKDREEEAWTVVDENDGILIKASIKKDQYESPCIAVYVKNSSSEDIIFDDKYVAVLNGKEYAVFFPDIMGKAGSETIEFVDLEYENRYYSICRESDLDSIVDDVESLIIKHMETGAETVLQ